MKSGYYVIGLMSGTSMDGLDLAYCHFILTNGSWQFRIIHAETVRYSENSLNLLNNARSLSKSVLDKLHVDYGLYLGNQVVKFTDKYQISDYDFIASHGHTIHHRPAEGVTVQIGSGVEIANATNKMVISDFRTQDVALGGQGAPLVPIGDQLLFSDYQSCLNLGGFANVSFETDQRIAFDISPANIVLNYIARREGVEYDEGGEMSKKGTVIPELLMTLNTLPFYHQEIPKSLGIEWVEENIWPLIGTGFLNEDVLATLVEHISTQISIVLNKHGISNVLVSGGGVYNLVLMNQIQQKSTAKIVILDDAVSEYKEALVFAFLGVLRSRNEINVLSSVTGAKHDHCAGRIDYPKK